MPSEQNEICRTLRDAHKHVIRAHERAAGISMPNNGNVAPEADNWLVERIKKIELEIADLLTGLANGYAEN